MARLGYNDLAIAYATEAGPGDIRWLTPSNASFLGISVTWNNASEKATPGLSTALSRAQIEDALLRQRSVQLLRAKLPGTYNEMVDNIVAAQAEGSSWTSSLLQVLHVGISEGAPSKIDDFGKLTGAVAAKFYASEWIGLNTLYPLSLLQKENPTLCAEVNIMKSYLALYRDNSPETEKWKSDIVRMHFDMIEIALSADPPEIRLASTAEKKLFEKWLRAQINAFIKTLSEREINFLRSNKPGPRVHCKYNIFFLTQLQKNRKMADIYLRWNFFEGCQSFVVLGEPPACPGVSRSN
jgi:hypothetical protein